MVSKKVLLLLALALFCSLASAEEFAYQNQAYNITRSIRVEGGLAASASCNLTLYDPYRNIIIPFRPMTYNTTTFTANYTIPSNTLSLANVEYSYDITCISGNNNGTFSFPLTVNPIGRDNDTPQTTMYIILFIFVFFIFCVLVYGAWTIPKENVRNNYDEIVLVNWKKYLKIFCFVMAHATLTVMVYIAWNLSYAYVQLDVFSNFFKVCFYLLVGLAFPIFLVALMMSVVSFVRDRKLDKMVQMTEGQW